MHISPLGVLSSHIPAELSASDLFKPQNDIVLGCQGLREEKKPTGLKIETLFKHLTFHDIVICSRTPSGSTTACCRLTEAQQLMYTLREREGKVWWV